MVTLLLTQINLKGISSTIQMIVHELLKSVMKNFIEKGIVSGNVEWQSIEINKVSKIFL